MNDTTLQKAEEAEALADALRGSRLFFGTHSDRWNDQRWQREFWREVAETALAHLSTTPVQGSATDQHNGGNQ